MIRLHETVRVARSAADCYRYLLDFATCEQWDPGVYRAEKITPGTPAVGSEFDVTVSLFGRRSTLRYRITDIEPDTRIELAMQGNGISSREAIALVADASGGTEIDYRADFQLSGALRLSETAARPLFRRVGRKAVAGLADALTIKTEPPRQSWPSYAADRSLVLAAPMFTERGYLALDDKSHSEFMDDRVVVVTGATSGIGEAIASEYARLGATVVLVGRDADKLAASRQAVHDFAGGDIANIHAEQADLLSVAETRALGERLKKQFPGIDVLVNNAGAMFDTHALTADGFERTLAINLVAPFVLTETLMGALIGAKGRVVDMSSGGMYLQPLVLDDMNFEKSDYSANKAYARAKRGLVALTRHWARRYGEAGVNFNAMHPGWAATPGVTKSLPGFDKVMGRFLRDARMGADTAVWLGAAHAAGRCQGEFFLDRTPHPTAVLANTRVRPSDAQTLYGWLRNETGIGVHGFG
jgi:NAD(P)-dependent dehydrogenase (short-subunit alcohol dehydrogenase family)/carbon monoxide dehydrogenase subunit G